MTIRRKIILIVLPLILTPILLTVLVSSLSARNGITIIASDFLRFKSDTLVNYARAQWDLLESNNLAGDSKFVAAARDAAAGFAGTIVHSDSEIILAADSGGSTAMATRPLELSAEERKVLADALAAGESGWRRLELAGERYVGQGVKFEPFGWYILTADKESVFYAAVMKIFLRTTVILTLSLAAAVALLFVFSNVLTRPLNGMVAVIREIISTGDLSKKVELQYRDETGQLGHFFNLMTGELEKAYGQIKKYAYEMVLAKNTESRIRHIFQKYVPNNVIEEFEANPETMLKGDNRVLAVLFSDIRSFTSISESMMPDVLVESLNGYFEKMVDVVLSHAGIVDKYIGDAIMAFFGAPVKSDNDALKSVEAGLGMLSALRVFNARQIEHGLPPFDIGIGINYGLVTVGNIGSEKKMEYTVIGDMVNLASRLEGLTKMYHEPIIISESVQRKVDGAFPCRLLDRVIVKGKSSAVKIYTVRESLTAAQRTVWEGHEAALDLYMDRRFGEAREAFRTILRTAPEDRTAKIYAGRCEEFLKNPPPESWQGEFVLTMK
jgi:class 3 adenylate cyclase/HAMP domain-containing protein